MQVNTRKCCQGLLGGSIWGEIIFPHLSSASYFLNCFLFLFRYSWLIIVKKYVFLLSLDRQLLGKNELPTLCKWDFLAILCPYRKIQVRSLSWELWHVTNCTLQATPGKQSSDSHARHSQPWDSAGARLLSTPSARAIQLLTCARC